METKTITVGEKTYKVRELLGIELDEINFDDKKASLKTQVQLSTGLTDDEYKALTVKERTAIIKVLNDLNGYGDFQ